MKRSETFGAPSDDDYEILDHLLRKVKGGKISNLEILDGFLTALVIGPDFVSPSEFLPVITSGTSEGSDIVFESEFEIKQFYGILIRYWNHINDIFMSGDFYMPYLNENEHGKIHGNDWAQGFILGTHVCHDSWTDVLSDEERGGPLIPILALLHENDDDPALRPYEEPVTQEQRETLIAGMISGTKRLFEMFRREREVEPVYPPNHQKVGRNDPCPCGSGKKFKKCCGQLTFH